MSAASQQYNMGKTNYPIIQRNCNAKSYKESQVSDLLDYLVCVQIIISSVMLADRPSYENVLFTRLSSLYVSKLYTRMYICNFSIYLFAFKERILVLIYQFLVNAYVYVLLFMSFGMGFLVISCNMEYMWALCTFNLHEYNSS